MTQLNQNKMKDNRIIAEFMGSNLNGLESWQYEEELQYHTSWDWLMPVVSKITRDEQYWEEDYREYLMDIVPYGHIEDTYDAVVQFIKQYNDEKQ